MKEINCTCPFTGHRFNATMHEQTKDLFCNNPVNGDKFICYYNSDTDTYSIDADTLLQKFDLVSQTAAAYILGVTRQRVNQIVKQELIKPIQIDGRYYFKREDVLKYKEKRKIGAPRKDV